eukprot:11225027-Lingulodinium_polyedra.AAC.1
MEPWGGRHARRGVWRRRYNVAADAVATAGCIQAARVAAQGQRDPYCTMQEHAGRQAGAIARASAPRWPAGIVC